MRELETVELRTASGRWPEGTVGTVLEVLDGAVLVEIADERGHSVDFLTLPQDAVRRVEASPQESFGV